MKYLVITLILVSGVLAYLRVKQPQIWNSCLSLLVAPDDKVAVPAESPPMVSASTNTDQTPTPPPPKDTPTIISPNSTNYLNPDHIRPVLQPGEAPSDTNEPAAATSTTNAPATNAPTTKANVGQPIPKSIPSTITTLSGKTYTGCVLSQVTPDGITFLDSSGGAKVLFSDLDPKFAASFNYDPVAAKKYEAEEAAKEAQSDAMVASTPSSPAPEIAPPPSPGPAPPQLSDADRAAIQDQIDALNSDIAFMKREVAKEEGAVTVNSSRSQGVISGNSYPGQAFVETGGATHGAYSDKIVQEERQVAELQKKLQ